MDNGAKEGLEKKLAYFKDKDYQFEFGVTLGQALNLAYAKFDDSMQLPSRDIILSIFNMLLTAKSDPKFISSFDEYYSQKKTGFDGAVGSKELPIIQIE